MEGQIHDHHDHEVSFEKLLACLWTLKGCDVWHLVMLCEVCPVQCQSSYKLGSTLKSNYELAHNVQIIKMHWKLKLNTDYSYIMYELLVPHA